MVESFSNEFILTPTPSIRALSLQDDQKESPINRKTSPAGTPVLYDIVPSASSSGAYAKLDGTPDDSMNGDARGRRQGPNHMAGRSQSNRRRSPRSHASSQNHYRPPNARTSSSSALDYAVSSGTPTENTLNISPPPMFHYPAPAMPYPQRSAYRQYMVPAQPHMNMEHPPPLHFGYTHGYHYPGIPDGGSIPPNIHANYQHTLQPSRSVYPYQSHSPDGIPGAHNPFTNPVTPPIYPHLNPSPPMHSPPIQQPPPGHGSSGQFHSLHYPSSMSPTQYPYPPQSFPASSHMYPGQYAPSPYARHFPPSQGPDRQGTWWYLPHSTPGVSSPQYESEAPTYQGHYPMTYSTLGHHEIDSPYSAGPSNTPTASRIYSTGSLRPDLQPGQETGALSPHALEPASPLNAGTTTTPSSEHPPAASKPVVRRSYHPNPPTHRSEWVMWAGNVPSDATHDELWRFFNKTPEAASPAEDRANTGVLSIFLISRSSCAFINFETEPYLHGAIEWFNGKPLRPLDPRCPRLVCRVRRKDDDLKAGVGGQRGMGMHTRWVKDQKVRGSEPSDISETSTSDGRLSTASSDQLAPVMGSLSLSSDEEGRQQRTARLSSGSGSFTSTNSSFLSRYFPNRFFILKSLTQFDLDLSVEKGLWATQKHNEGILDQAYRTSQNVYLIFSVNKSGEFYGFARMAGPVRRGEHRVSWATRTSGSSSSRSSLSPATGRVVGHSPDESPSPSRVSQLKGPPKNFFNTPRLVDESPQPAGSAEIRHADEEAGYISSSPRSPSAQRAGVQSAPAELGLRQQLTMRTPVIKHSLDHHIGRTPPMVSAPDGSLEDFELDPTAPIRAMRAGSGQSHESSGPSRPSTLQAVAEEEEKGEDGTPAAGEQKEPGGEAKDETWGESFKVEWLCTDRLPFHKTRHIRNPWNHDREVKVSRDGTEVEPIVGQRLLDEWERLVGMQSPSPTKAGGASKRGSRSAPPVASPMSMKQADGRGVENMEARGRGIDGKGADGAPPHS